MNVDIHDVGHGFCAVVTFSNGSRIMIDAGTRTDPFWAPSTEYFRRPMDLHVLQNLDEDHVADLPYLLKYGAVKAHFSNPTVDAAALAWMKRESGMGKGVSAAYGLLLARGPVAGMKVNLPRGAWAWAHWNRFGYDFVDTNNLSVATFVGLGNFTILFGGDLEEAGWRSLLRSSDFRAHLARVSVLVTSHHGRENGCCDEIFRFCRPGIAVISDCEHRHLSQQTASWYRSRVTGIPDNTAPRGLGPIPTRSVITTRKDGRLTIRVEPGGRYTIQPERLQQTIVPVWPVSTGPASNELFNLLAGRRY